MIQNLRVLHTEEYFNEFALIAKISKLNFPKYDGYANPLTWICQIQQCFEVHRVSKKSKILKASLHLSKDAQLCYHLIRKDYPNLN